jgi:hypothetical protein
LIERLRMAAFKILGFAGDSERCWRDYGRAWGKPFHFSAKTDLVQIGGVAKMFFIDMDTLSIEQDNIPDGGRSDTFKGEVELLPADTMHQLDA